MNFFPDFAPNSRKEWRLLLFQSNLRKQIRKLPKILKFVRIIQYYSKLFTGVLRRLRRCPPGVHDGRHLHDGRDLLDGRHLRGAVVRDTPGVDLHGCHWALIFNVGPRTLLQLKCLHFQNPVRTCKNLQNPVRTLVGAEKGLSGFWSCGCRCVRRFVQAFFVA